MPVELVQGFFATGGGVLGSISWALALAWLGWGTALACMEQRWQGLAGVAQLPPPLVSSSLCFSSQFPFFPTGTVVLRNISLLE